MRRNNDKKFVAGDVWRHYASGRRIEIVSVGDERVTFKSLDRVTRSPHSRAALFESIRKNYVPVETLAAPTQAPLPFDNGGLVTVLSRIADALERIAKAKEA